MQLDLNLLTALDALLEEGSVGGAAARLHVTAPAMSRSLGRIRKATGDQILVRTGRSMVPTTRALAMRAQVHALVQQAHQLLSAQQELDLAALERVFTVRWHDALTAACGTALFTAVHRQAPGVQLRLSPEPGTDTPSCAAARSTSNRAQVRRRSPTSATASSAGTAWSSPSDPATPSPTARRASSATRPPDTSPSRGADACSTRSTTP